MKKLAILSILFLSVWNLINTPSQQEEVRGVFISYIEIQRYLGENQVKSKRNIRRIVKKIKKSKMNTIILQIRSNSDAIYPSKYYPWSKSLTGEEGVEYFDVLGYFLEETKKENLKLYAWINPYRIRTIDEIESISTLSPAYPYLNTEYIYRNNGVFFNPSKKEVEDLIVKGVEEVIENYDVDGILFDDYFYPGDDVDNKDYEEYINQFGFLTIRNYRLNVINHLVKRVYRICHKKNVLFGISPDGNIENNYENHYADVKRWVTEKGYIDFIMPQIYYGFLNETKPFYQTVKEWDEMIKNNADLIVALALYKSGTVDEYAKSGREEWINNNNILKKEVIISRNRKHYKGFAIFRYDNFYEEEFYNDQLIEEVKNLTEILN